MWLFLGTILFVVACIGGIWYGMATAQPLLIKGMTLLMVLGGIVLALLAHLLAPSRYR